MDITYDMHEVNAIEKSLNDLHKAIPQHKKWSMLHLPLLVL